MAKRQAEISSHGPVSAFAARKVASNLSDVGDKSQNVSEASQVSVANHNEPPPAKKQRTRVEQKTLVTSAVTRSLIEVEKGDHPADVIPNSDHSDSGNGQTKSDHGSDFGSDK